MNDELPAHVRLSVESICALGCERVNEIIAALESGRPVIETTVLSASDQRRVLHELKAIMAVYDRDTV